MSEPDVLLTLVMNSSMRWLSFLAGFLVLFIVYHIAEFYSSFWLMAVTKLGFLPLSFFVARMQGWKGLDGFGLSLHRRWWRYLLSGILTGILFYTLSVILSVFAGFEAVSSVATAAEVVQKLPTILLFTFFPSIAEDILTRGYLYGHLKTRMKPLAWMLLSAFLFLMNHIWRLADDPSVLLYLFLLGLVLAWAVWQTKALWLAFGIHWGANITYESTNSIVSTETVASHHESTWVLAGCWLLLLLVLLVVKNRLKDSWQSH